MKHYAYKSKFQNGKPPRLALCLTCVTFDVLQHDNEKREAPQLSSQNQRLLLLSKKISWLMLLQARSIFLNRNTKKPVLGYSSPFFVELFPLAFSISASFSAFFLSNSACFTFSSCAFRNNLTKFKRVAVTCSKGHRAGSSPK